MTSKRGTNLTTLPAIEAILRFSADISVWWLYETVNQTSRGAPFIRYVRRPGTHMRDHGHTPPTSWWVQRIGPWEDVMDIMVKEVDGQGFPGMQRSSCAKLATAEVPTMAIRIGSGQMDFSGQGVIGFKRMEVNAVLGQAIHDELIAWLESAKVSDCLSPTARQRQRAARRRGRRDDA